jgi:hypothetical protein
LLVEHEDPRETSRVIDQVAVEGNVIQPIEMGYPMLERPNRRQIHSPYSGTGCGTTKFAKGYTDEPLCSLHRTAQRRSQQAGMFRLGLDNGTHCRFFTGGARRARNDGYVPVYACGADSTASVLGEAGSQSDPINRSKPLWAVTFKQPGFQTEVRSDTTAWFAGT